MARWKALAEFLLSVIELLFLSLTVEALQGKTCQNSQPSGVGRWLWAQISEGRGRPWGIFFGFYKTRHILLSNGGNCTVLRADVLTQYRRVTDRQTDRRTELPLLIQRLQCEHCARCKNGSRGHDHASFSGGLLSIARMLLRVSVSHVTAFTDMNMFSSYIIFCCWC